MPGEWGRPRGMREAAEETASFDEATTSKPALGVLSAVNPIVVGIYVVHVLALIVLYVSSIMNYGVVFPTLGLAILSVVELVAVKSYLDEREALERSRRMNEGAAGGPPRQPAGPYTRVTSGSDDE